MSASKAPWPDILDTRNPDIAYRHLTGCYVGVDNFDVLGNAHDFRLNRRKIELGRFVMVRGKLNTGYRLRALPGAHLVAMIPESGSMAMRAGSKVAESGRQRNGIVSPRDRFSIEYQGASGYTILIAHELVVQRLDESGEKQAVKAVNASTPLSLDLGSPAGNDFRAAMNFVWMQLASTGARRPPALLAGALEEVLLCGFLRLLRPGDRPPEEQPLSDPGRRLVQQACEILRARIEEPVQIAEVASTLGVTPRHLQAGFRRHFGKTPQTFLIDCRLDLARRMLMEAEPGQSVTAAALECGFSNLGDFASRYRRRFGENPSRTLRNAQ